MLVLAGLAGSLGTRRTEMIATISAGSVEYSIDEAIVDIDEFIEKLEEARDEGATHIVGLSGNYRGASYVRLGDPTVDYDDDEGF